jgi:cyclic beta-1,2-glucan glucanotransferase
MQSLECALEKDPSGVYSAMDERSKALYRRTVLSLSKAWGFSCEDICASAVSLALEHEVPPHLSMRLRSHVGYYFLDDGLAQLRRHLGARPPRSANADRRKVFPVVLAVYTFLVLMLTAAALAWCSVPRPPILGSVVMGIVLGITMTRVVFDVLDTTLSVLVPPSSLPSIDLHQGIREDLATIVAVPVLLLNTRQAEHLAARMQNHFNLIRDRNVYIVLLTDDPDSAGAPTNTGNPVLEYCASLVNRLNKLPEYSAHQPFFLLHRQQIFCETQQSWMGWERKRGKIETLFSWILSGSNQFICKVGDMERLRRAKYAVVIDEDCTLQKETVHQLVGTLIHPLNHPHVNRESRLLLRGYGILQPTVTESRFSDNNNTLANTNVQVRDLYQDTFGQTSFLGKGIVHVDAYCTLVKGFLPEQRILSHDIVEAGFVRTGGVPWIKICEREPSSPIAHNKRQHRWMRGDWQNILCFLSRRLCGSRFSLFGRWLIVEAGVQSLLPIALTTLLVYGAAVNVRYIFCAILSVFGPSYFVRIIRKVLEPVKEQGSRLGLSARYILRLSLTRMKCLVLLPLPAVIAGDAILRTILRFMTRRNLLEWHTAADSERKSIKQPTIVDLYPRIVGGGCLFVAATLILSGTSRAVAVLLLSWGLALGVQELLGQSESTIS